ncbi:DUF4411 family protein [Dolosigranulum pigrum]|uniref:DUF4411 family protein n=1 Tax=Dolosigranulum pigrum TaxID=29394 RepID=UPI001AD88546|nr:DUF4411 family protein [Dolosigranulum pigrum]QTJ44873.1 DUF4411 family protein [Dolosigranulum pigrum]
MYLLDTNIYINFYDRYYRKEYFPSFWNVLPNILNKYVVIPDKVISEAVQSPWFNQWIDEHYEGKLLKSTQYVAHWGEVLNHVRMCGFYQEKALTSSGGWAEEKIADGWLIAIAKEENYTVVTQEKAVPSLNKDNPSKRAKIPDVCNQLGVRCIDMNEFFREVSLKV